MQSRATVSFVSKEILSSSDGIKHDEVRRIEGTVTEGGLEVRKPANRDLEKLRQRQHGQNGGLESSSEQGSALAVIVFSANSHLGSKDRSHTGLRSRDAVVDG